MTYRLSRSMPKDSRLHEKEYIKKKHYFILEGQKTEVIYFKALSNHLRTSSLTEILILERIEGSKAHQLRITEAIEKYIKISQQLTSRQNQKIMDLLLELEEEIKSDEEALEELSKVLATDKDALIVNDKASIKEQLRTFRELSTFNQEFDNICIVIDRDRQSFKSDQFDQVIDICQRNNFYLGITNPNFEFYLLLHLIDAQDLSNEDIKRNINISKKIKFVESKLKKEMESYAESFKKNEYNPNLFIEKFKEFERNIKYYEHNNEQLKDEIGSSVHHIVKELIEAKKE